MYIYGQGMNELGWIATVAPCAEDSSDLDNKGARFFYGPNVLNIKIFTDTSSFNYYPVGDILTHEHTLRLINTYDNFQRYGTIVILDIALLESDPNLEDFDTELKTICKALKDYGFIYYGQVDSSTVNVQEFLKELITTYFENPEHL